MSTAVHARGYARRAAGLADSSLKDVLATRPGVISFAGGLPDENAFEYDVLASIAAEAAREPRAWQYCPTEGLPELRDALAERMRRMGIPAGAENVLITTGSQQALDLVAKAFVDPGDPVMVEAPGYIGALKAVENYEGRIVPVPLEADGLSIQAVESLLAAGGPVPKYLYTVSNYQNPAGCTLAPAKRRELLRLAREYGFLIVEDGAYHELSYEGAAPAPIAALDNLTHTLYLGSFSKALVPGIRVGWIVAPSELVQRLALLKQATDLAGSSLGQMIAYVFLRRYGLRPPLQAYKAKRDLALSALAAAMPPGIAWNRPEGGFFLWMQLPRGVDAKELLVQASARGVSFVPGYAFGGVAHSLRFSFSQVALADIEEGVARLAGALHP